MTKTEIYNFFIKKGALPCFEIVDSSGFELNNVYFQFGTAKVDDWSKIMEHYFNEMNSTTYIYSQQDFSDDMEFLRLTRVNVVPKMKRRMVKLQKIKNIYKNEYSRKI